jgi:hypothetical protein
MDKPSRRRLAVFAIPLVIALVMARRAAPNVRAVDFLLVFASGVLFGVTLMGLIQMWKRQGNHSWSSS